MKTLITVILLFLSYFGYSQKTQTATEKNEQENGYKSNFVVVQGKLIWRKVFEDKVTLIEYEKFLKLGANVENIEVSEVDSIIICRLRRKQLSFIGFKDTMLSSDIPPYLKINDVFADVKIEIKQNKYRVTIYEIKLIAQKTAAFWQQNEVDNLELYYYRPFSKNKYVSDSFIKYSEPVFDKNFNDKFQYKNTKSDF